MEYDFPAFTNLLPVGSNTFCSRSKITKVTENRYRFTFYRFIVLWSLPTFFLFLFLFLFFAKFHTINQARAIDILGFLFLLLFSVGTFVFLFFNHLPLARRTELIIKDRQELVIVIDGKAESINFSDIASIKEYTAKKLPWGLIMKWCITANDKEYVISSLTISQLNFERHFNNKTDKKIVLFRTV